MTDRELMKKALDALEYASDQTKPENLHGCDCLICTTILALRERLAQPERQWVGLTEKERINLWREFTGWGDPSFDDENLMKAIEAKLKEENA